jgi:NADPH-dependent 7-cyano-7-deazaguanine reductase QueF
VPEWSPENTVLGDPGARPSDRIDVIAVPGPMSVELECTELTAVCPVTEQRDFYDATISFAASRWTIESKTLKLYLATFVDRCVFAEHLAHEIAGHLAPHVEVPVTVSLRQHVRGGIRETVTVTVDPHG